MSSTMKRKVASRIQAGENGMSASLWVGRPTTPLTDDNFLEKQTVLQGNNITKTSLAVCHPKLSRGATHIYFAYIESGELKITRTHYVDIMERHEWEPVEFSEWAEDVALCFDGTMPKAPNGWVEFKTEQVPWVFWVLNGVLYGRKLDDPGEPLVLAEANCSAVSAVRAMWSSSGGFDFGLVVFFLLSGQLYYRQLINGEWMDAGVVSFGPDGVKWEALAAFRTWDYRVGVQLKSTDGAFYEMFTQFMGVGKQLTEHIEAQVRPKANYIPIKYTDSSSREHLEVSVSVQGVTTYGLSSVPTLVRNLDDGTGNYGLFIQVVLDYPVTSVDGNVANFTLADGNGTPYICTGCSVDEQGLVLLLEFMDFNLAEGTSLTLDYTPGTIMSPAVPMEAFSVTFEPEGLVAPNIPVPEPIEAWNTNAEGTEIALRFSQKLTGDITGLDTPVDHVQKSVDLSAATITALNFYSSSQAPGKVADGNLSTMWRGSTSVNWIQFQLPEPKVITSIRMYMGSYYIKTFTMSGSNDGSTWTQLGGEYAAASSSTSQWYDIPIDNEDSYLYYRVNTVTTYGSRIYLYEVELCETVAVGNEIKLSLAGKTYDYVPGGELEDTTRTIVAVSPDPEDGTVVHLKLSDGNVNSLRNLVGDVTITYSGGTWRGQGGPVEAFEFTFTPTDLQPKFHPGVSDHLSTEVVVGATLTEIHYTDLFEPEHLEAVVTPIGNLISIDDI
jgi:hypothetical protein